MGAALLHTQHTQIRDRLKKCWKSSYKVLEIIRGRFLEWMWCFGSLLQITRENGGGGGDLQQCVSKQTHTHTHAHTHTHTSRCWRCGWLIYRASQHCNLWLYETLKILSKRFVEWMWCGRRIIIAVFKRKGSIEVSLSPASSHYHCTALHLIPLHFITLHYIGPAALPVLFDSTTFI